MLFSGTSLQKYNKYKEQTNINTFSSRPAFSDSHRWMENKEKFPRTLSFGGVVGNILISPYVIWRHRRSDPVCKELKRRQTESSIRYGWTQTNNENCLNNKIEWETVSTDKVYLRNRKLPSFHAVCRIIFMQIIFETKYNDSNFPFTLFPSSLSRCRKSRSRYWGSWQRLPGCRLREDPETAISDE